VLCDDRRLAALADEAFEGPGGRASGAAFTLQVRLAPDATRFARRPPPARMSAGAGWLCGVVDAANYALVHPRERSGLVSISPSLLEHRYHARYELLEFAALTLLARGAALVPLHAACFGTARGAVLLLGDSGAGKSTLCAAAAASGWRFVSEDATFVAPDLVASGIPFYLHLRAHSLSVLDAPEFARRMRASPTITRRSGVRKYEADLRTLGVRMALAGLPLRAIIVMRRSRAGSSSLRPLKPGAVRVALERTQSYAAGLDTWPAFAARAAALPAYDLHRMPPAAALAAIHGLLEGMR